MIQKRDRRCRRALLCEVLAASRCHEHSVPALPLAGVTLVVRAAIICSTNAMASAVVTLSNATPMITIGGRGANKELAATLRLRIQSGAGSCCCLARRVSPAVDRGRVAGNRQSGGKTGLGCEFIQGPRIGVPMLYGQPNQPGRFGR